MELGILKNVIQPLVENSISHGFNMKDDMGHIVICAYRIKESVIIEVEDDGVGVDLEKINNSIHNQQTVKSKRSTEWNRAFQYTNEDFTKLRQSIWTECRGKFIRRRYLSNEYTCDSNGGGKQLNIVIADDEEIILKWMKKNIEALSPENHVIASCINGMQVLNCCPEWFG